MAPIVAYIDGGGSRVPGAELLGALSTQGQLMGLRCQNGLKPSAEYPERGKKTTSASMTVGAMRGAVEGGPVAESGAQRTRPLVTLSSATENSVTMRQQAVETAGRIHMYRKGWELHEAVEVAGP